VRIFYSSSVVVALAVLYAIHDPQAARSVLFMAALIYGLMLLGIVVFFYAVTLLPWTMFRSRERVRS
jgi:uncharacterized membrane protein YkvI